MGIKKSFEKIDEASIILLLVDASTISKTQLLVDVNNIENRIKGKNKRLVIIANKIDTAEQKNLSEKFSEVKNVLFVSAKEKLNIEAIKEQLYSYINSGALNQNDVIVTNARHYEALTQANEFLTKVLDGLDINITGDFLAMDIRQSLHYLGLITGDITTDDLLDNIFSKFCIGK
jgi:tRNA modification GTPase